VYGPFVLSLRDYANYPVARRFAHGDWLATRVHVAAHSFLFIDRKQRAHGVGLKEDQC